MVDVNETERAVLRVIRSYQRRFSNSPTMQEISDELRLSSAMVRHTVDRLIEKGFLDMQSPPVSDRLLIVPLWWE